MGFVYYVRYTKDGKLIPSRWCTHTNDKNAADRFAEENRDRIIAEYYDRKTVKKPTIELYSILKKYYAEGSPFLEVDRKRGRALGEDARKTYYNFITKQFIPYLRKNKIRHIEEIDTPLLHRLQNYLLVDKKKNIIINSKKKEIIIKGIKPQTIGHYISYISQIFDHLLIEGHVRTNPCKSVIPLKVSKDDQKITGCLEINKIKGIFNKKWKDELSCLLSLIIYTTNMRNSEIEKISINDLIKVDNIRFIDIPKSKSPNGVRKVPLHPYVYNKIIAYARKNKKGNEDYIFKLPTRKRLGSDTYTKALTELAVHAKHPVEKIKEDNLRFYSGRHFWKTLMNSEDLGDVEEYFMGHKISEDVAKRYNHRDKQGRDKLIEKAKKVFEVLDKHIFLSKTTA